MSIVRTGRTANGVGVTALALAILTICALVPAGCTARHRADQASGAPTEEAEGPEEAERTESGVEEDSGEDEEELSTIADVTVYDLDGNEVSLSSFFDGPAVLVFWATWCGPCNREMPDVQKLHERYGDEVQVVAVSVDDSDYAVKEFLKENGYTMTVLHDPDQKTIKAYAIHGIPTTFFLEPGGRLAFREMGRRPYEEMCEHTEAIRK